MPCSPTIFRMLVAAFICHIGNSIASFESVGHQNACRLPFSVGDSQPTIDAAFPHEDDSYCFSRRQTLQGASVFFCSQILYSPRPSDAKLVPASDKKQTIVITGGNSGVGLDGATRLAARGHKVVLACRTMSKAQAAVETIAVAAKSKNLNSVTEMDLVPAKCDLASLDSIAAFARSLRGGLGDGIKIDVLCLNAGIARNTAAKDVLRTREGFELTVGTNHVGHFYLNQLLLPMVNRDTGRIVVTASSVHDPDSPGGAQGSKATLGNLSGMEKGADFEMVDGGPFDADKAYKDSKLCNVLFTRELQRRLIGDDSSIVANCFTPGLIVGTGLFRDQNPVFTKVFDVAATNLLKVGETPHWGGGALEFMALDEKVGLKGGFITDRLLGRVNMGKTLTVFSSALKK